MSWERITSRENKQLRLIVKLASSAKTRTEEGLFVCEGRKLLEEALRDGAQVRAVVWPQEDFAALPDGDALTARLDASDCRKILVPGSLFAHISILENSPGPLFVCAHPAQAQFARGLYIALDGVQDPGNIGTILRTAEAFGTDGVILLEGCADPFQPKVARASMGSLLRQPLLRMDADGLFEKAEENGMPVYAAALYEDSRSILDIAPCEAVVLIGSEGKGVKPENIRRCTGSVLIPMSGKTESLNAAIAAAIVMWEMKKWRENTGSGFPS